jgi:hypothetical protein
LPVLVNQTLGIEHQPVHIKNRRCDHNITLSGKIYIVLYNSAGVFSSHQNRAAKLTARKFLCLFLKLFDLFNRELLNI